MKWFELPGYPSYLISRDGEVWSKPRLGSRGGLMAGKLDDKGYWQVTLTEDGKQTSPKVATLVALTFLGPRPEGLEIRHLNGNSADDRADNLAYGTKSENTLDQVDHGTHRNSSKELCPAGHEYDYIDPRGGRQCKTCRRDQLKQWRKNKKEQSNALVRQPVAQ